MSGKRWAILTLGPPLIVAAAYAATMTDAGRRPRPRKASGVFFPGGGHRPVIGESGPATNKDSRPLARSAPAASELEASCRRCADELRDRLDASCHVVVRPPFVVAGDLPEAELERYYRQTLVPTARALSTCYFDRRPDEPLSVLLFSGEAPYRRHAQQLDGNRRSCYSGYYLRGRRRVVVNIASGEGTLAHELTHALAHFDFPAMPEWFDEGLASLHEESEFAPDGLGLIGLPNWRLGHLREAIRGGRQPALAEMMTAGTIRGPREAELYATARYFCMYLQQRGLLCHYYRKFRATAVEDPTGVEALKRLLHVEALEPFEREFHAWVAGLLNDPLPAPAGRRRTPAATPRRALR